MSGSLSPLATRQQIFPRCHFGPVSEWTIRPEIQMTPRKPFWATLREAHISFPTPRQKAALQFRDWALHGQVAASLRWPIPKCWRPLGKMTKVPNNLILETCHALPSHIRKKGCVVPFRPLEAAMLVNAWFRPSSLSHG